MMDLVELYVIINNFCKQFMPVEKEQAYIQNKKRNIKHSSVEQAPMTFVTWLSIC